MKRYEYLNWILILLVYQNRSEVYGSSYDGILLNTQIVLGLSDSLVLAESEKIRNQDPVSRDPFLERFKPFAFGRLMRSHYRNYFYQKEHFQFIHAESSFPYRCIELAQTFLSGKSRKLQFQLQFFQLSSYQGFQMADSAVINLNQYESALLKIWQPPTVEAFIYQNKNAFLETERVEEDSLRTKFEKLHPELQSFIRQTNFILNKSHHSIESADESFFDNEDIDSNHSINRATEAEKNNSSDLGSRKSPKRFPNENLIEEIQAVELWRKIFESLQSKFSVRNPIDAESNFLLNLYVIRSKQLENLLQILGIPNYGFSSDLNALILELFQSREQIDQHHLKLFWSNETNEISQQETLRLYEIFLPKCHNFSVDRQTTCLFEELQHIYLNASQKLKTYSRSQSNSNDLIEIFSQLIALLFMLFFLMGIIYVSSCIDLRNQYEILN
ncbi:hypothetical protein SSS_06531 [Sarcoptes scabiei]|uniref:Uncharacterized protein n=1 Tax=Sarcoptes scabiei TaxID=52283 RepID=A0A834R194_SARSC|nr:hypothetical protein SSS_06531 [Sarcoptes scabiei]